MAVPKRKLSKSRKRLRRGHHVAASVKTQACPSCGYYRGKKVVEVKAD